MVLDTATKPCELFPESLRFAAYGHVRELKSEAVASLQAETDGGDVNESASPPAKRAKTDSRSASLKLPATAAVTLCRVRVVAATARLDLTGYCAPCSFE